MYGRRTAWVPACGARTSRRAHERACGAAPSRRCRARRAAPGAVERPGAGVAVARIGDEPRQRRAEGGDRVAAHQQDHRVAVGGVEGLDRVRERVHRRGDGQRHRQRQREVDVVDHRLGPDIGRAAGGLLAVRGLAEDVGHLGSGVGGRDGELVGAGSQGDGLAEAGRRAAAEADHRGRAGGAKGGDGAVGDLDGGVHRGLGEAPAARSPRLAASLPAARWRGPESTRTFEWPSRRTSSPASARVPEPKTTRVVRPGKTNRSIIASPGWRRFRERVGTVTWRLAPSPAGRSHMLVNSPLTSRIYRETDVGFHG